jgi:hypothetical protein
LAGTDHGSLPLSVVVIALDWPASSFMPEDARKGFCR